MDFDGGRIQAYGLDTDAYDVLALPLFEDVIPHAALGPAIHAGVDGMPISEAFGQAAPLTAVLGDLEQGVQPVPVVEFYVAALAGKTGSNTLVLRFGDLHADTVSQNYKLVLTRSSRVEGCGLMSFNVDPRVNEP